MLLIICREQRQCAGASSGVQGAAGYVATGPNVVAHMVVTCRYKRPCSCKVGAACSVTDLRSFGLSWQQR